MAPSDPWSGSVQSTVAPYAFRMRLRSDDTLVGIASRTGNPSAAPSIANAIPVFPLVASSSVLPGVSRPRALASRTMLAAARSFTLPPGLVHSALASRVIPSTSRTGRSRRIIGVFPMRSGIEVPGRVSRLALLMGKLRLSLQLCEIGVCGAPALSILADWIAPMARKSHPLTFEQMLDALRSSGFDVRPFDGVAGGVMVSKATVAAVLVPGKTNDRWES